jgi:hypothetical protein
MATESNSRASDVSVTMMNLLWPRPGIPVQLFYDYWVGAHTQISSRLPGIYQYFQHQLDPIGGKKFPKIPGVSQLMSEYETFYGDAEITFLSEGDLKKFAASLNPLMEDEQNVFKKTISYQSYKNNSLTFLDSTFDKSPNGDLGQNQKYMLYIRKLDKVKLSEFQSSIKNLICSELVKSPEVVKLRVRLLEIYDNSKVTLLAPNVDNAEDISAQYQASIEIVFADPLQFQKFSLSFLWLNVSNLFMKVSKDVHTFRVINTFTVYNNGRITLAGLRTPSIARKINEIGAINQVGEEVLQLLTGVHPGNPFD